MVADQFLGPAGIVRGYERAHPGKPTDNLALPQWMNKITVELFKQVLGFLLLDFHFILQSCVPHR